MSMNVSAGTNPPIATTYVFDEKFQPGWGSLLPHIQRWLVEIGAFGDFPTSLKCAVSSYREFNGMVLPVKKWMVRTLSTRQYSVDEFTVRKWFGDENIALSFAWEDTPSEEWGCMWCGEGFETADIRDEHEAHCAD